MEDDPKALVRRFVDEYQSAGNVAVADELLADDFVDHSAPPGMPSDREGVKALFSALRQGFPDLRAEVHDMLVDGDKVEYPVVSDAVYSESKTDGHGVRIDLE